MPKRKYQELKKIEGRINQHLFLICSIVTIITMVLVLVEFFSRGAYSPARIELFYLGVLVVYSFHKELIRWIGEQKAKRQGELFVYGWILVTMALYVVNFINQDYYIYSPQGEHLTILRDVSVLTLEVLTVFIITRSLKIIKNILIK